METAGILGGLKSGADKLFASIHTSAACFRLGASSNPAPYCGMDRTYRRFEAWKMCHELVVRTYFLSDSSLRLNVSV